jgi:hypothetical protein
LRVVDDQEMFRARHKSACHDLVWPMVPRNSSNRLGVKLEVLLRR